MKLIIHIGTEKTGSSSLQLWGAKNRELLKENKIFYSKSLGEIDHRKASVYPLDMTTSDDGLERYGIANNDDFIQFKEQVNLDLKNEVDSALSLNCNYFIVYYCSRYLFLC